MRRARAINNRVNTFSSSDSPLTSRRVKIILSSPTDSKKLARAVREARSQTSEESTFKLSNETVEAIDNAERELQNELQ